ncbi:protein kinase [Antrihabitans sp. YC3-6]|uniref:Serine/threonine-protein kinase PknK n=1 Tax=Antrihabitans stalagmiti TaxID=2799499 RepID=A0A934NTL6_9NOCA|nr:serine/threonine-protein kinase [Antrihabitans stalagmiti]MBJ8341074.1 protein kinase [Antrihabitans stalagmiti]
MVHTDPSSTQPDLASTFVAELAAAGFEDAREIGRGGFGVVYRCEQRSLDRTVAIKVLTADLDEENLQRFLREQRAMGKLSGHPNIVTILEVGATAAGRPYIVMQHHPHGSLEGAIHRDGPISWKESVRVGIKMSGALETAHLHGTLHRDVKPGNILLTEYGEPQLTDFGIARISGGFETSKGAVTGSPAFTAPEVLQGHPPDPTSDVYSLASTLFCSVTGHAVFERRSGEHMVAQFLRITKQPTPDLSDSGLPADVAALIERAMSRERGARPSTPAAFGELLQEIQRRHSLPVDDVPVPIASSGTGNGQGDASMTTGSGRRGYSARTVTPPAPATRFRPPAPTRALVGRNRLIEQLQRGQQRRLTVIHGPTGFGKSTLAAQWCERLTEDGHAIAWLTVDHDDNNVVWFLSHLIEAIRAVRPALAHELAEVLEEHGDESERYVLTSLINDIHATGERMTVVVDDWHRISDRSTILALRFLLDNCCPGLHVVVTSRSQQGLPMSRMRMQNQLLEIDSAALRFDNEESHSFLVDLGGLDLDRADVADLTESTDGWVAALQLASLSLRGSDDPSELIGHLTGRHHAISEFLAENVLDTLEPDMLDFLLATSVTERICGDLASALADVPNGQLMLEEVAERDLFLHRVDDQWFRYHHLFADFLRQRLERQTGGRVRELHRTASQWFADNRHVSDAVDHALAAGDQLRAVEIVEQDGTYLLEHSQMASLIGLVEKLPETVVDTHARLQLALAWANIFLHRAEPARHALRLVESTLDESGLTAAEIEDLRIEACVVHGVVALRADVIDSIDELVAPCLARPDTLRPFVVSVAANLATFAAAYRCDRTELERLQDWAVPYRRRNKGKYNEIHALCFVGLGASLMLDIEAAERSFRKALKVARHSGGSHSYTARLAGSLLGELLYERGDVTEAERLLDEGYKLGAEGGSVDFKIARYVVGARIKALQGDRAAATRRLNEGARIGRSMALTRLSAEVENERIRLGLPPHPEFGALPVVQYEDRRQPTDPIEEITALYEEATAIRLLLAQRDRPEKVELARVWAQEWVDRLRARNRPRALLKVRRLLVACLVATGRIDEAKLNLATILAQCARLGSVRYILDGGPYVVQMIAALREDQVAGRWASDWPEVPAEFLIQLVNAEAAQEI